MFKLNFKKSQISIFVIIAVILVIVGIFFIFNSKINLFSPKQPTITNQVSSVVTSCINKYGKMGVFFLGFQGGYINIPKIDRVNPLSNSIVFGNNASSGLVIPSWNSINHVPTISSMQNELNLYVENKSFSCIKSQINSLKKNLNVSIIGNLNISTRINSESITFTSTLPIKFKKYNSNKSYLISQYYSKLDNLRLKQLYDLALQIYNKEYNSKFLEKIILNQIYSDSDYSSKNSMPTEGMSVSCSKLIWTYPQLKENLAKLNNNNFRYMQFIGTYPNNLLKSLPANLYTFYSNPIQGYIQNLQSTNPSFLEFKTQVFMPSVDITGNGKFFKKYPYNIFKVSPNSGQIVSSRLLKVGSSLKIPIPCLQIVHNIYNLDYNLMIKLTDMNSKSNGFFFQFPIRVQIQNSEPKQSSVNIGSIQTKLIPTVSNQNYCSNISRKYPTFITVINKENGDVLNGVNISYSCVNLKCNLGQTSKLSYKTITYGHNAILKANFPYCLNGQVKAIKSGFNNGELRITTNRNSLTSAKSYTIKMIPKITFKENINTFLLVNLNTKKGLRIRDSSQGSIYVDIVSNSKNRFESQMIWPDTSNYFNTISFLDDPNILYNITAYYMDSSGNLKGMLRLDNWKPDIKKLEKSSSINFVIPIQSTAILSKNYNDFYLKMKGIINQNIEGTIKFGINFNN